MRFFLWLLEQKYHRLGAFKQHGLLRRSDVQFRGVGRASPLQKLQGSPRLLHLPCCLFSQSLFIQSLGILPVRISVHKHRLFVRTLS